MKTKTIKLYEYSELSPEAKEKALQKWRETNDFSMGVQVSLDNLLSELLEKHGIKPAEDYQFGKIYFSLAHCQGDGVMFYGTFDWKKYRVYIKHSGHYYHSNSKTIEIQEQNNLGFHIDGEDKCWDEFEQIYQSICKELEKEGYEAYENEESEAHFIDDCNANEWTFRADGTMENVEKCDFCGEENCKNHDCIPL